MKDRVEIGHLTKYDAFRMTLKHTNVFNFGKASPKIQGRGRRLLKFSYIHHSTKSDATSGLNWAPQLVSQSEKMAFRSLKISLCLWTISFVSVYNEDGKIFQAHSFDFLSKNFWKTEQFSIVLKENIRDPSVIEWRILHICKSDVAQTLVVVVRDSVITLSVIAYNVNNNLDEVLLAIVYTVYSGT